MFNCFHKNPAFATAKPGAPGTSTSTGSELDEISRIASHLNSPTAKNYVNQYGQIVCPDSVVDTDNLTRMDNGTFGSSSELDEVARIARHINSPTAKNYVNQYGQIVCPDTVVDPENLTRMDNGTFGAGSDQWYDKNPALFEAEVANMRKFFPNAAYGFLRDSRNMYWIVTLDIFEDKRICEPWQVLLIYDKDHPHNHGYGGSIKPVPLKPSLDDIKKRAAQFGRPGVPHTVYDPNAKVDTYLCTRLPEGVADGKHLVSSARQVAAWVVDWAVNFEIGLRDKDTWNKWVDDKHFRHLKVS